MGQKENLKWMYLEQAGVSLEEVTLKVRLE